MDTVEETMDSRLVDKTMASHPRYDPQQKTWVNFAVGKPNPLTGKSRIHLYEICEQTGRVLSQPTLVVIRGVGLIHDFVLTEHYCVFVWTKCKLGKRASIKAMLGMNALVEAIDMESDTTLLVVPRDIMRSRSVDDRDGNDAAQKGRIVLDATTDPRIKRIPMPFLFNFHFGNGYEITEDGHKIVLDLVETTNQVSTYCSFVRTWRRRSLSRRLMNQTSTLPHPLTILFSFSFIRFILVRLWYPYRHKADLSIRLRALFSVFQIHHRLGP